MPHSPLLVFFLSFQNRGSSEYLQSLLKQASKLAEDVKASIRRTRQRALTDLKNQKGAIAKDDMKKLEDEVQKITDAHTEKVDQLHKAKKKALSGDADW